MAIKAQMTAPNDFTRKLTVLYSGDSKSGKTHAALTWPDPGVLYYEVNMATLQKFPNIPFIMGQDIGTIENLEMVVLPSLEQGKADQLFGAPVQTIVLDSLTEMFSQLSKEIQGTREKLSIPDFGRFLSRGESIVKRLVSLSKPTASRPAYNFVATVHLRDVQDDEGNLVKVRPAIPGQMKDILGRFFDTVFVNKMLREERVEMKPDGTARKVLDERRIVWSLPQDKYHACGDGIGGGILKVLPGVCAGTYPELIKAWGLEAKPS